MAVRKRQKMAALKLETLPVLSEWSQTTDGPDAQELASLRVERKPLDG
jgi:hypothetical protein